MDIVILHDHVPNNAPPDQLDNLIQAREIASALTAMGHQVQSIAIGESLENAAVALLKARPDVVFNLVESIWSSSRWLHLAASLMGSLGIRYTGSGSKALRVTTHKIEAKQVMAKHGLPTPAWLTLPMDTSQSLNPTSYILKSVVEHASFGLDEHSILDNPDPTTLVLELNRRITKYGGDWFAERFIEGREFNIALLAGPDGPAVLPVAEITFEGYGADKAKVVDYRAKWDEESYEYHHTPRRFDFPSTDTHLLTELHRLSRECWSMFGLKGWARVDFRVDHTGKPWILEVNSNPCLAGDAGFMAAAQVGGLDRETVLQHILVDALSDPPRMGIDQDGTLLHACG